MMHGYSHTGLVTQVYCACSVNGIAGELGDNLFVYTVGLCILKSDMLLACVFLLVWPSLEAAGSCSFVNEFYFFNLLISLFW